MFVSSPWLTQRPWNHHSWWRMWHDCLLLRFVLHTAHGPPWPDTRRGWSCLCFLPDKSETWSLLDASNDDPVNTCDGQHVDTPVNGLELVFRGWCQTGSRTKSCGPFDDGMYTYIIICHHVGIGVCVWCIEGCYTVSLTCFYHFKHDCPDSYKLSMCDLMINVWHRR